MPGRFGPKEPTDERPAPPAHTPRARPDAAGHAVGAPGRGRRESAVRASPLSRRHRARALDRRAGPPREEHRRGREIADRDPRLQAAPGRSSLAALPGDEVEEEMTVLGEDVLYLSATELGSRLRTRQLSPVELAEGYLARIDRLAPKLNAFVTVTRDRALAQARQAEKEIAAGKVRGPLHRVPYATKDLLAIKGVRTTWC